MSDNYNQGLEDGGQGEEAAAKIQPEHHRTAIVHKLCASAVD